MIKKLVVIGVSAIVIACGTMSASALRSPCYTYKVSTTSGKCSPCTGVSADSVAYAGLAALACGSLAVVAKKKISE
ncbi:MAG: hypothetical protein UD936_10070 [Acutalibacteraceae bacterium]|nr:hypothetical protein [Acutalibacteraceae bacterium]